MPKRGSQSYKLSIRTEAVDLAIQLRSAPRARQVMLERYAPDCVPSAASIRIWVRDDPRYDRQAIIDAKARRLHVRACGPDFDRKVLAVFDASHGYVSREELAQQFGCGIDTITRTIKRNGRAFKRSGETGALNERGRALLQKVLAVSMDYAAGLPWSDIARRHGYSGPDSAMQALTKHHHRLPTPLQSLQSQRRANGGRVQPNRTGRRRSADTPDSAD